MSYEKAMKHARNVRKCRKQSRMYFGFDCCGGKAMSEKHRMLSDISTMFITRNRKRSEQDKIWIRSEIRKYIQFYRENFADE
jgi:hypothetical protein